MAKKSKGMKPKEKRELEKQKRIQKAAVKSADDTPVKAEATKAVSVNTDLSVENKHNKKSAAKALGLKSGFVVGDDLYLTSFGRGNEAKLEKKISGETVEKLGSGAFEVTERDESTLTLESGRIKDKTARPKDPRHITVDTQGKFKEDMLGIRSVLEEKIFGKKFDDNIHVQLAYNILDIEKIMAQYVSDIVYMLHNTDKTERNDNLMGYMSIQNPYSVFCNPNFSAAKTQRNVVRQKQELDNIIKSGRLGYFGEAFMVYSGKSSKLRPEKEIYHIFALMASLRQSYFHGFENDTDYQGPTWAYTLEDKLKESSLEFRETLDKIFDEGFSKISKNFGKQNNVNLQILEEMLGELYGSTDSKSLACDYYDFIQLKKHKYLGFSIKRLRETMLETTPAECYKAECYNSIRHKLYKLIDFLIYDLYYNRKPARIEEIVDKLRGSVNDEEKESIYSAEAKYVYEALGKVLVRSLKKNLNGATIKDLQNRYDAETANRIWDISEHSKSGNVNCFCKLIYMMTLMLDGKEINDLLTTLVNKFDNIASFIDVMDELGLEHSFTYNYKMFADSKAICLDLQFINSFARMSKIDDEKSKRQLFRDALVVLDIGDKNEDWIEKYLTSDIFKRDENGNKIDDAKRDFRNFIANYVIKSARFKYLVKYSSADGMIKLKKNEKLISFVLEQLPETQIDRYYESCGLDCAVADRKVRIEKLTGLIRDMRFDDFRGVNYSNDAGKKDKQAKAKYQAIISLYLMVLYQIVKNMIYVNSRYVIAFHCLERDLLFFNIELDNSYQYSNCNELTDMFIKDKYMKEGALGFNMKAGRYLTKNIGNCSNELRKIYRNQVDHFAVVRKIGNYAADIASVGSWFELYHYVIQRIVFDEVKSVNDRAKKYPKKHKKILLNHTEKRYRECINNHHSYCKDLVKALNTPFGYDLPRYQNLSIGDLFDRNNYLNKTKESIDANSSIDNP